MTQTEPAGRGNSTDHVRRHNLSTVLTLAFPVWLMVLSVLLFHRARAIPAELLMPAPGPMVPGALSLPRRETPR